jgi:hypothetical protein
MKDGRQRQAGFLWKVKVQHFYIYKYGARGRMGGVPMKKRQKKSRAEKGGRTYEREAKTHASCGLLLLYEQENNKIYGGKERGQQITTMISSTPRTRQYHRHYLRGY